MNELRVKDIKLLSSKFDVSKSIRHGEIHPNILIIK